MNYDFETRTLLEDEILGFIMEFDDGSLKAQKILFSHGIDESTYFNNAFNQHLFNTMLKCWENGLPANLINCINFRPDNYRNKEDPMDKKGFDTNLIVMISKGKYIPMETFELKLWVLKRYILMDYWNNVAFDISSGIWDFREELQVGQNIIDGYNILFDKITKSFKASESVVDKQRDNYLKKLSGVSITVPSGIAPIDAFTGGWHNGELVIMAARPAMGKSTMALIMAIKSAFYHNKKTLFSSFEMPKIQVMNKVASYSLSLDYHKIKNYEYDQETMEKVFKFYEYLESKDSKLVITDTKEVSTISDIDAKIKSIGAELFIPDYLQLIGIEKGVKIKAGNREQEIAYISGSLKKMAVSYDIPIIALSQLSRAVENRSDKRPQLSDLRESGSIEQDADIVIFLYRDAYYKELSGNGMQIVESERWDLEMKFAKGRDLGTKTLYLYANYITYEVRDREVPAPPIINV